MTKKQANRKKKQRKILLTLLLLLITCAMLGTSTYAWFTANKTVTVSEINVNVAAANGLQISVDGANWKSIITNQDILDTIGDSSTYTTNLNQLPYDSNNLSPVSSIGFVDTSGLLEMFSGSIDSDINGVYKLTTAKSTEISTRTAGNFIAFDLFFQVQEDTEVYLTDKSSVTAGDTDSGIQNATRIAFIDEGTVDVGSTTAVIQALKGGTTAIIWEPNYDVHTASAVQNALNVYGLTTTTTGASALGYYGVKAAITAGVDLNSTDANYFAEVTPDIQTVASGISVNSYESVFTLNKGITKMRVYMWVEGQDVDCENNASGGEINFNLQFSSNSNGTGA